MHPGRRRLRQKPVRETRLLPLWTDPDALHAALESVTSRLPVTQTMTVSGLSCTVIRPIALRAQSQCFVQVRAEILQAYPLREAAANEHLHRLRLDGGNEDTL